MKDFIFIHTNWTAPAFNNRWSVGVVDQIINNIWYYSLSAAYLKRINQQINLHTDTFGKMCLDHIPYDNIYLTLDSIPKYIKPYMWAYGKFHALKRCPLNTIHIDADVFIKSNKCIDKIKYFLNKGCDGIVQCHEFVVNPNKWSYSIYKPTTEALSDLQYPEWANKNGQNAFNTGFLMFNNKQLKSEYLKEYFRCAKDCSNITALIQTCSDDKFVCPDLVLEQQFLYDVSNNKYNIKLLIDWTNSTKSANAIDYQHVIGKEKYNEDNMYRCKKLLSLIDKDLYVKTVNKTMYIKNYLNKTLIRHEKK